MAIKSIRLQNFKGFKDTKLELKPLTVILGPNSAGKSSFGQALVALSKSHLRDKNKPLNLMFDKNSSVEFGGYSDLVHAGCDGQFIKIELRIGAYTLKLGFGAGKPGIKIKELDLTEVEIAKDAQNLHILPFDTASTSGATTNVIKTNLPENSYDGYRETTLMTRMTEINWALRSKNEVEQYKVLFDGLNIHGFYRLTGTEVDLKEIKIPFQDSADLLEKVHYLRPDRAAPLRKYETMLSSAGPEIDDFGDGAVWYVQEYGEILHVDTFLFPHPTSNANEAQKSLSEVVQRKRETKRLREAVSDWLDHLGLAVSFETKIVDGGRAIKVLVTPPGQKGSRALIDVGFGVSQVLPILVKGLCVKENGLFVVEQPEAQLHPKPQAELADFFCSMVKCGRNVLVETHSEALFHRLRILADMDDDLSQKIAIYFIDEPSADTDGIIRCSQPRDISLKPGDEFKWPTGFLYDGVEIERQVRATRIAKKRKEGKP